MKSPFDAVVLELLGGGSPVRFRASGDSMYPSIRDGERITVAPVAVDDLASGDVLLYRQGGRLLAHRLVVQSGSGAARMLHLRGDGKGGCDAPVQASAIVGRVTAVERSGRSIALCGSRARLRRAMRAAASRAYRAAASRVSRV
jgi:hypothetical protein